jgi:hypothetical protein
MKYFYNDILKAAWMQKCLSLRFGDNMGRILTTKSKPIHLAKMIREDGAISPLCAVKPRKLDLKISSWTNRKEAVTCNKCLDIISN